MKNVTVAVFVAALLAAAPLAKAQDPSMLPTPQKEHEWLKQFVGEWESEAEVVFEPGKPPVKLKGTESGRSLGGFWIVAENKSTVMDKPMTAILTVGYDPQKKKYIGTWVDSMTTYMWKYEGTVDETGKILTLETEGPNPMAAGKTSKFKDVTEFKSKDHKVLTSWMLGDDGKWASFMTVHYRRKK